jgi:ABC-type Mn2+/Zn2+ transport system permease subunit
MDILSAILGLVSSIAGGFFSWLDKAPTNNSVLIIVVVVTLILTRTSLRTTETMIQRLRDLIIEIEDKKRGNWP